MDKLVKKGILISILLLLGSVFISSCDYSDDNEIFNEVATQLEDEIEAKTDEENEKKQKPR